MLRLFFNPRQSLLFEECLSVKPIENAFAESFNRRLRDEYLNTYWFISLKHAREIIEDWRQGYNKVRPHSSLNGRTPMEYAKTAAVL